MYPKEYMWTMNETVEMTTSIITEIGSSRIPRSICRFELNGSHSVFHGIIVGKTPSAFLPALK